MDTSTQRTNLASGYGSARYRMAGYWLATIPVVGEMGLGGIWDITRIPYVRDLVIHLGYPSYFLVLLGTWKVLGAVALLVPGRPLLKEWAYAGAFFTYTGAMVSHLTTGYDVGEVGLLAVIDGPDRAVVGAPARQPPHRGRLAPWPGWRLARPARSPRRSLSHFFTGGGSPGAM